MAEHVRLRYTLTEISCAWQHSGPFCEDMVPSVLWRCWLGGRKGIRPVKNLSGGVLAWLSADLHMAQLMPLPLTVFCFCKTQIGFTFLVPAYLGSPGKGPLNRCVFVRRWNLHLQGFSHVKQWIFRLTQQVTWRHHSLLYCRSAMHHASTSGRALPEIAHAVNTDAHFI